MTELPNSPQPLPKPRQSRLAVASLVFLGCATCILISSRFNPHDHNEAGAELVIPCLACLLGSLILGVASLVVIHRSRGRLKGTWMVVVGVCAIFAMAVWPSTGPGAKAKRVICCSNLKQIHAALNEYHSEKNHYPPSLSHLYPRYIKDLRCFRCPSAATKRMQGNFDEQLCSYRYIYYPDDSVRNCEEKGLILVFENSTENHGEGLTVMYMDGCAALEPLKVLVICLENMANNEKLSRATRDSVRKTLQEVMAESRAETSPSQH